MKKLTNRHLLPFYLTLAAVAAHATPTLTFGTITGTQAPGNTITVNVLLTNNGAAVSGINFDLTYASGLTVSLATGSAASAAGKSLNSSNPQGAGAGVKRALIAGFNTETIADGTVAAITIVIPAGAAAGPYALAFSNVDAANPAGESVPISATDGAFQLPYTAQTVSFTQPGDVTFGVAPVSLTGSATSGLSVSFASTTSPVCTVSGSTATIVGAGTCSITATQSGNGAYAAATGVTRTFAVARGAQIITFAGPASGGLDSPSVPLTASTSAGLTVTFSSGSTSVCTVSGSTVTLKTVGTCSLKASQAGNNNYEAASDVVRTFSVSAASQTITFAQPADVTFGVSAFTVSASAAPSDLTVAFASTTTNVCTLSGVTVTIVGAGTCTLTANQAGNGSYAAATQVTRNFNVAQLSQIITFSSLQDPRAYGSGTFSLGATASSSLAVTYVSTTTGICTVSGSTVTLVGVGSCSITASQAGNDNVSAATPVVQAFTVVKGTQSITFAGPASGGLDSPSVPLTASAGSGLTVTFISESTSVCTVSGSTVTLKIVGTCALMASQAGNNNYEAASDVVRTFLVSAASQTITFAQPANVTFGVSPVTLGPSASSLLTVTLTSTTTDICTVSGSTVTILAAGSCSLTATQAGTSNFGVAPDVTRTFTVAKRAQTITFGALSSVRLTDSPVTVSATAAPSGLTVAFASTTTGVCTVAGTSVTLVAVGTCSLTASQAGDGNNLVASNVTQSFSVTAGVQTITFAAPSDVIFGVSPFSLTASASSVLTVAFASTTANVCTVATATVTILAAGTCTVAATQAGNANYAAATAVTRSFTVARAAQTVTFNSLSGLAYTPSTFQVAATSSSVLAVTFNSATSGVCTVAGTAVSMLAQGTCTITASQAGNSNYLPAPDVPQSFVVGPGIQTITFFSIGNLALGTTPFLAGATSSTGLPVSFTSTTTSVCTVSGAVVTLLTTGTCSLNADQTGSALYGAAATVTQAFTVRAAPACTYSLNSNGTNVGVDRANGAFKILTTPGCPWTAVSGIGWLTLTSGAAGTDSGEVRFTASTNASGSSRTGTITAGGQTYSVLQFAPACSFALSSGSAALTSAGGSLTLRVSGSAAGCTWTSSSSSANVTITPATGTAPGQVTLTVAPNTGVSTSNFAPVIGGQTFNISEGGINCTTTLSASSASFSASGGPGSVDVTVPAGCSYAVVPGPSWLSVTSGAEGTAGGGGGAQTYPVLYTVDASSSSAARSAILRIGGEALTVSQDALACSVSLDTSGLGNPFAYAGGTGPIVLGASSAGCAWRAVSPVSWITLSASNGTGNSTLTVTVAANASGDARGAKLSIGGQVVSISQAGPTCSFTLGSASGSVPASGGNGSVAVAAATGCTWTSTADVNAAWLTITASGSSGTGDVNFSATANTGNQPRTGTLTLAGKAYTVTQAGAPCAYKLSLGSAVFGAGGGPGVVTFNTTVSGCTPPPATTRANWLTVSQVFSGTAGTVNYSLAASTSGSPRTTTILIGDQTFTLTQAAATCAYTLSSTGAVFGPAGGTANITATASGGGCTPTVSSPPGMVTLGSLSGPVSSVFTQAYTVAAFSSATNATRVTSVNVGGKIFQIKQRSF